MRSQPEFQHLLSRMLSFHAISPGFILAMEPLLDYFDIPKGHRLLTAGNRPTRVWYILEGFVKEISYDSGIGRASWFWSPGDFVYAYPGFFSQGIAANDIEGITECRIIEISYEKFMELNTGFPEVPALVEKIREYYERQRYSYTLGLSGMKAADRFKKFMAENRELFLVAKRKDIAGFLGIQDDSLRRYG